MPASVSMEMKPKKLLDLGGRLRIATTEPPKFYGLPSYYKDWIPANWANMSEHAQKDFFRKIERWHDALKEGPCNGPAPGEKVVYFIRHGMTNPDAKSDAMLLNLGREQARNLKLDPMLNKALGPDKTEQAQLLLVSPTRKCLQTALLGFADSRIPKWEIEPDLQSHVRGSMADPDLGVKLLTDLRQTSLLSQYESLPKGFETVQEAPLQKWRSFMRRLQKRPEQRIFVISDSSMVKEAGLDLGEGQVGAVTLTSKGEWRRVSPPTCWPTKLLDTRPYGKREIWIRDE